MFVFALVNRPYILDLVPQKSVVGQFVNAGFDIYLIDWGKPTHADRRLTFDSYVNGYLLNVVDFLRRRAPRRIRQHARLLHGRHDERDLHRPAPRRVKNLILMAAGIDFATRDGLINLWTRPESSTPTALSTPSATARPSSSRACSCCSSPWTTSWPSRSA